MKKVAGVAKEIRRGSEQGPDVFAMHGDKHSLRGPLIQSEQDVPVTSCFGLLTFFFYSFFANLYLTSCVALYKKQKILN